MSAASKIVNSVQEILESTPSFVNVSASIDNIVFCVVYISVIAQAIQRILSTVKAIMSAVGLFPLH